MPLVNVCVFFDEKNYKNNQSNNKYEKHNFLSYLKYAIKR